MKRRAVVLLGEDDLARMVHLNEGEQIYAFWPDNQTFGIKVGIMSDDLPEVAEGAEAPRVHRPLTVEVLRRQMSEFRKAWLGGEYANEGGRDRLAGDLSDLFASVLDV